MDPIKGIAEQVKRIAETVAKASNPVTTGTVLSRNSDGSYNVDDGSGGCVRVANLTNQPTQCGAQVVLGIEPQIGQTLTVCPTTVTVSSSTKPCPTDDRTDENEEEEEVVVADYIFVDEDGNRYNPDGSLISENGPDTADVDASFGYSFDGGTGECKAGETPTYDALLIGDLDDGSGNQGEVYSYATALALNTVSNRLLGAELKNIVASHEDNWKLVLRNATTFAIIASTPATNFLNDWINDHPTSFFGAAPYTFSVHISPDPEDGHFWVTPQKANPPDNRPMFKVSSDDLSLLETVELAVPDQFTLRGRRHLIP